MDYRKEMPENVADATPGNRSEHLRALKKGNDSRAARAAPASPPGTTAAGTAAAPARVPDKRRRPRYRCEGSAEFLTEGVDMRTWATITDMSLSGCYVELPATSAVNTPVNLTLDVKGLRIRLKGIVRTSYPLLGMGIEFTDIPKQEKPLLDELLRRLADDATPPPEPEPSLTCPVPEMLKIMDAGAALKAVARFFQNNRVLTHE
jgi:PilZ domain